MARERLDRLTIGFARMMSRRGALRLVGLSGLAAAVAARPAGDVAAKKKKKCKKCQGRCFPKNSVCCPPEIANGACGKDFPVCCPPSPNEPEGHCTRQDRTCCFDTSCAAGETCCSPSAGAPGGSCVPSGTPCLVAEAARRHAVTADHRFDATLSKP
jgi:hypothetical protein